MGPRLAVGPCVGKVDKVGPAVRVGVIDGSLEAFDDGNAELLAN